MSLLTTLAPQPGGDGGEGVPANARVTEEGEERVTDGGEMRVTE